MKLSAIRHLPTPWNKQGLLQGSRDISILAPSEDLLSQIAKQKKLLSDRHFDRVLASPMVRTHQTAELYGYSFEAEPLIAEIAFEEYEGKPKQQMLEDLGDEWYSAPYDTSLGPQIRKMESRIVSFVDKYSAFDHVLMFSHGAYMRGLLSYNKYGNLKYMNTFTVENNQLITFEF